MLKRILILEDSDGSPVTSGGTDTGQHRPVPGTGSSERVALEGLVIDKVSYAVYLDGERKVFPKKEFELLLLLASDPNRVFRREYILSEIWGPDFRQKDSRSLDVHIRMIRKKLDERFISTVRGVGYKLSKNEK